MSSDYDKLASGEIEQHSEQMLYADRQLAKEGNFEAVASNLRKRSYIRLVVGFITALCLFFIEGYATILAIVILLTCAIDYTHTTLTQATIRRMRKETESIPKDAEADH